MISSKDSVIYVKKSVRSFLRRPDLRILSDSLKYYSYWKRCLAPGKTSITEKIPWMAFSAIEYLEKIIRPEMEVFEYGSGGSTLFWASRVRKVVSVEHDKGWFETMRGLWAVGNVDYLLVEAQKDADFKSKRFQNPDDYISSDEHYAGMNFEKYVKSIDAYPDRHFDVIVVDGRARPSCIKHSLSKLKRNGWLIVDNSDRAYYLTPFSFNRPGWKTIVFEGPVPFTRDFSRTTFFQNLH